MLPIDEAVKEFDREVSPTPHDRPSAPLYHYTTTDGLLGILSTKKIWAAHFSQLNDRQELEAGSAIIHDVATTLSTDSAVPPPQRAFFDAFVDFHAKHTIPETADIFVASFSQEGNLLSQWRAYAGGGGGYSIGLQPEYSDEDHPEAPLAVGLLKCTYDENAFRTRVRHDFLAVSEALQRYVTAHAQDEADLNKFVKSGVLNLMAHTGTLVPRFKDPSFAEEREWRVIAMPRLALRSELVKFRTAPRGVVPFMEIPLCDDADPLPLAKVILGPTADAKTGLRATRLLLERHGFTDKSLVEASGIPFRS